METTNTSALINKRTSVYFKYVITRLLLHFSVNILSWSADSLHWLRNVGVLGKSKDGSDSRFDRGTWKVMQVTMNDTSKFVDMLHNVPWEDGLPSDVVQGKLVWSRIRSMETNDGVYIWCFSF